MHLEALYLRNFRSYTEAEVAFSPGVNAISGANAQGKTNLLEAIHLLSTGRSFRTTHLEDLVRKGEKFFYLEARFKRDGLSQTLKISYDSGTRFVEHNFTRYPTFSSLLGILPSILFAPEDHQIISGTPADRRRFLDLHIAQSDPLYVHHLMRYFKAMKQRNHLLRRKNIATIELWEQAMAQAASYLVPKRAQTLVVLEQALPQIQEPIRLTYQSSLSENFLEAFQKMRPRELHIGNSILGPHRDDIQVLIAEREARAFSSEGQKRSCVAALRLAQWSSLKTLIGEPPLMGIDDFGVHLDPQRNALLQAQLHHLGQVFLTAPTPIGSYPLLTIQDGKILSQ